MLSKQIKIVLPCVMNNFSITTPALLFPAITLLMLAYTNRFLALSSLVRNLHAMFKEGKEEGTIRGQIKNLRKRLNLVKNMQAAGALAFFLCLVSMMFVYFEKPVLAFIIFGISLLCLMFSLLLSLWEISISTGALEIELKDMEK